MFIFICEYISTFLAHRVIQINLLLLIKLHIKIHWIILQIIPTAVCRIDNVID